MRGGREENDRKEGGSEKFPNVKVATDFFKRVTPNINSKRFAFFAMQIFFFSTNLESLVYSTTPFNSIIRNKKMEK